MKKILFGLAMAAAFAMQATDVPLAFRNNTINATLLSASATTTTNKVGSSLFVEGVLNHSFQFNNGTTAQQCCIDWSLDNSNWVLATATNALTANQILITNFSAKVSYVRARQIGTNSALTVIYLGGN